MAAAERYLKSREFSTARGHGFAKEMLRRTLIRARELQQIEVWLTCAKSNVASVRTILANGGVFLSEEFLPERSEIIQRYRIGLGSLPAALPPSRSAFME